MKKSIIIPPPSKLKHIDYAVFPIHHMHLPENYYNPMHLYQKANQQVAFIRKNCNYQASEKSSEQFHRRNVLSICQFSHFSLITTQATDNY